MSGGAANYPRTINGIKKSWAHEKLLSRRHGKKV